MNSLKKELLMKLAAYGVVLLILLLIIGFSMHLFDVFAAIFIMGAAVVLYGILLIMSDPDSKNNCSS